METSVANARTPKHQFLLADQALSEAEHLYKAGYWLSCVSNAYQVALRGAAGLLYQHGFKPMTEREVRMGFLGAFVSPGVAEARMDQAFRELEKLRHAADFEHDHEGTREEAEAALEWARAFHAEVQRLRNGA